MASEGQGCCVFFSKGGNMAREISVLKLEIHFQ